jgi:hypothetical protein
MGGVADDAGQRLHAAAAASSAVSSTTAAAPSEMLEELAAVTLPSFLKAGRRVGILAMSDLPGCSSVATSTSPLRVATFTATISSANAPVGLRGLRALDRLDRVGVLLFAGEAVLGHGGFGEHAHGLPS